MTITTLSPHSRPQGVFAATIGFFDGVHRGHRYLVEQLRQQAAGLGLPSMVITFSCHPRQVVQPQWQPQLLTTLEEKTALLRLSGADHLVVLPFDAALAALSAQQFMQQVLRRQLGVEHLLTGYDNHFGHRTAHSTEGFADYAAYGRELGIGVACARPLLAASGEAVSSSLIRRQLSEGEVEQAAACLGRRYTLTGTVVAGEQMGRRLGFPTANLVPDSAERLVPASGVYAVMATTANGQVYGGMTNIGTRPTFGRHQQTIETHLFGFHGDLYGQQLTLSFVSRLRSERTFTTPRELARQMAQDAARAQSLINNDL